MSLDSSADFGTLQKTLCDVVDDQLTSCDIQLKPWDQ